MKFQFFLPDILNLPTGGNIFNQHLMGVLSRNHEVKKTVISSKKTVEKDGKEHLEDDSHWIVDSLLLWNSSFMERLVSSKITEGKWLLVHYLNILDPQNSSGTKRKQEKEKLSIFDGFIVTSYYSKKMLIESGIAAQKIEVIQPGIVARFSSKRKRRMIIQILTVSSLFRGKGLLEFFPILENLSNLPWQWILVGEDKLDPAFTQKFMEQLEDFRLKNRVQILGPVSQMNLLEIYKQSDIFVLNSRFESCSMVTMEALAFGLPVLVSQVGGLPELVEHEKNGYLVTPGDTHLFTDLLRNLISDPGLRLSMGEKAYQRSRSFPSWQDSTEKFLRFMKSHAKPPGPNGN